MADIDKVESVDQTIKEILKLSSEAQKTTKDKLRFEKQLQHNATLSLRRAFQGMSSGALAEQVDMLGFGGDDPGKALTNLLNLAREQNKPSITNFMKGTLQEVKRTGFNLAPISSVEDVLMKRSIDVKQIDPKKAYLNKADAWAKKLKSAGRISTGSKPLFKKVGGADVAEFTLKGGKSIYIPLAARVPISQTNYDIFGMYKGFGDNPIRLGDDLVDQISKGDINLSNDSLKSLTRSIEKFGGRFPRSAPALAGTGIDKLHEVMRSRLVNVQVKGGRKESVMSTVKDMLKEGYHLSGGTGPLVKIGDTVSDMVEMSYGFDIKNYMAFGNQFDVSRGLSKWVRPELGFTQEAVNTMRSRGIKGAPISEKAAKVKSAARRIDLAVIYGREREFTRTRGAAAIGGAGEAFASRELFQKGVFNLEQIRMHEISASKLDYLSPEVVEAIKDMKTTRLSPGSTIGYGFQDLQEVKALTGDIGTEEIIGYKNRYSRDQEKLTVVTRRLIKGKSGVKVFDGLKHTLIESDVASIANKLWRKDGSDLVKRIGADVVVAGDVILKNPAARSEQMTSGLGLLLRSSGMSEVEVDDMIKGHMGKVAKSTKDSYVARNVLKLARTSGLGAEDVGLLFGSYAGDTLAQTRESVQRVFGRSAISKAELRAIHRGRFVGVTGVVAGGSELFGDISTGTFEARGVMPMQALGKRGQAMSSMIKARRGVSTLATRTELGKALATLSTKKGAMDLFTGQQIKAAREITPEFLLGDRLDSIFHQEGTMVKVPKQYRKTLGVERMYLPSTQAVKGMGTYRDIMGVPKESELLKRYTGLFGQMLEGAPEEKIAASMTSLQEQLKREYVTPVSGKSQPLFGTVRAQVQTDIASGFRGKLMQMARRDLQGKSLMYAQGISPAAAEEMFAGMRRIGASPEYVAELSERLYSGKGVPGMMWRHPQIGKFSTMPSMFYIHKGATTGFTMQAGTFETGLSADVDADRLAGAFVRNKAEEQSMIRTMRDTELIGQYEEYKAQSKSYKTALKRSAFGKASAYSQVGTIAKEALGQEIGGVTHVMGKLYRGALHSGDEKLIGAMSFLAEYVPQELISAKHLSATEAEALTGISERMFSAKSPAAMNRILRERFDFAKFEKQTKISIDETISRAFTSYNKATATDTAFLQAEAIEAFGRGKGAKVLGEAGIVNVDDFVEALQAKEGTIYEKVLADPITAIKKGTSGWSGTETLTSNVKTMMRGELPKVGKSHAMIAGAAAFAGAMFYLGSKSRENTPFGGYDIMDAPAPIQTGGGSNLVVPDVDFQARPRFVTPESMGVSGLKTGMPEGPRGIQHAPRAPIDEAMQPMSSMIRISGKERGQSDYSEISKKIVESMKMPSSVNVNINDNSRQITSEIIDRLMEKSY